MNLGQKSVYVVGCVIVLSSILTSDICGTQARSDLNLKCEKLGSAKQEPETRFELGNLNRKAVAMPKPKYPADVKRAGVRGTVTVRVVIEVNSGRVVWVRIVSGPEALYEVTLQAACRARFYPTLDADVYAGGTLTYRFGPRGAKREARTVSAAGRSVLSSPAA
jgi:TonB family protein